MKTAKLAIKSKKGANIEDQLILYIFQIFLEGSKSKWWKKATPVGFEPTLLTEIT